VWEKYSSKIGTEQGPRRHVVENSQNYPHLHGFVAFDIEHWWAERSISVMINEKEAQSVSQVIDNKNNRKKELPASNCYNFKYFNSPASIPRTLVCINSSQPCIC